MVALIFIQSFLLRLRHSPLPVLHFPPHLPLRRPKNSISKLCLRLLTQRVHRPMVLLGSAGLALLLICLFGLQQQCRCCFRRKVAHRCSTRRLESRAPCYHFVLLFQRMLAILAVLRPLLVATRSPTSRLGAVIASPSTAGPNYFYSWVRDAALTMKVAISQPTLDRTLVTTMQRRQGPPAERCSSSSGQGEPKFNVDGSLFTGPWGRPQDDGPLSAFFAHGLRQAHRSRDPFTTGTLYQSNLNGGSIIKTDLEWVSHHWSDLPSIFGRRWKHSLLHFHCPAPLRSLTVPNCATSMNDPGAATYYNQQAAAIKSKLQTFWDSGNGFIQAYQGVSNRNGIDCSVMLGALKGWDTPPKHCRVDASEFGPASDKCSLRNKSTLITSDLCTLSTTIAAAPNAVGTGRYPSDVYQWRWHSQGNPWYICTSRCAEVSTPPFRSPIPR